MKIDNSNTISFSAVNNTDFLLKNYSLGSGATPIKNKVIAGLEDKISGFLFIMLILNLMLKIANNMLVDIAETIKNKEKFLKKIQSLSKAATGIKPALNYIEQMRTQEVKLAKVGQINYQTVAKLLAAVTALLRSAISNILKNY
ncbi:MAG: hypothetical protein OXD32_04780 [Endozoicomonadaceae bacterium]|nr:hypothetical protein [Endozoicomonadaceae bacterium]MCY4329229.1 hypothetical protein [Endozoicomonadaceae bacterium]